MMVEQPGGLPSVKETAEAVEGLVKAVPVYQDLVQPSAQEVGLIMARTVRAALAPLRGIVWGMEQIEVYLVGALAKRFKEIPAERIQAPEPTVAGPALEALRFAGSQETLRELYANLLAAAMDRETAETAHPAFVDVVKQLTPDEAKILKYIVRTESPRPVIPVISISSTKQDEVGERDVQQHLSLVGEQAGCDHPHLTPNYIENLCRLGLTVVPPFAWYTAHEVYEPLENHPVVVQIKTQIQADGRISKIRREKLDVTNFGAQFLDVCVAERA